jgi:hypothetical protein
LASEMPKAFAAAIVVVVVAAACSVQDGSGDGPPDRSPTSAPAASSDVPSEAPPEPESVGLLTIDDRAFDLVADCFAPGAGEVLVLAIGDNVEVYVEAFLGSPYLAIQIDGWLLEPSIDRPFEFSIDGNIVRAGEILLVRDLDLASGESTAAGTGTLVVECRTYLDELPESFRR